MNFGDSSKALFVEPNAYIQKYNNDIRKPKKVVFSEPYESLPAFYLNNNFKKRNCDCVPKFKPDCYSNQNTKYNNQCNNYHSDCDCNQDKYHNQNHNNSCNNKSLNQNGFGFDLKSLMPLLTMFKGGGSDLSSLVGLLNNGANSQSENNSNPMNLISSLMSNKDLMSGILNLFKGGGLNLLNNKPSTKKELKTTDFEIKNYTRVE